MASTVVNGAIRGTGSHVIQTLYNNTTGGNVRIVWNWMVVGTAGNGRTDQHQKILYGPTPTIANAQMDDCNLQHAQGNNLNVVDFTIRKGMQCGRDLAQASQSDHVFYNMTGTSGYFPLQMMIANTHKVMLWTKDTVESGDVAMTYNFVAIPE
tara:strand:- start:796 stop:1254 length:459 start_codon:yes stop_codon:yes gene_type:complete